MNLLLRLEYDGAAFHGWQRQANSISVQEELERALTVYAGSVAKRHALDWDDRISVQGSGRTDAGVHALYQAANFHWPSALPLDTEELFASINGISSRALEVRAIEHVPCDFNARSAPHSKRYLYQFLVRRGGHASLQHSRCWVLHSQLNIEAMIRAAHHFRGTHDFSSFRASDCGSRSTVRSILLSEFSQRPDGTLVYCIEGKGFLKQMVRIIAGTLVEVGKGERPADSIRALLEQRKREYAGVTAPAHGLFLERVRYL